MRWSFGCTTSGGHNSQILTSALALASTAVVLILAARTAIPWSRLRTSLRLKDTGSHPLHTYETPIIHGARYHTIVGNAQLARWEEAVAGLPWCEHDDWAAVTAGRWLNTSSGEVFFEPFKCRLRRLSAAQARLCLANTTVAFVGGSLSRYQYLEMAWFLARGEHPQRYGDYSNVTSNLTAGRSPTVEQDFRPEGGWEAFYQATNQWLQFTDATSASKELCNCSRPNPLDGRTYENRMLTVNVSGTGTNFTVRAMVRLTLGFRSGNVEETRDSIHAIVRDAVRDGLAPKVVLLVNSGYWLGFNAQPPPETMADIANAYEPLLRTPPLDRQRVKHVWKTTTASNPADGKAQHMSKLMATLARYHNWSIFDAGQMTDALLNAQLQAWWDRVHFWPFVYEQLNDALLNVLCPYHP